MYIYIYESWSNPGAFLLPNNTFQLNDINFLLREKFLVLVSVACAGFILAGAEKILGGQKQNQGGRLAPEGREKMFCPL